MDYELNAFLEGLFYGLVIPFGCFCAHLLISRETDKSLDQS